MTIAPPARHADSIDIIDGLCVVGSFTWASHEAIARAEPGIGRAGGMLAALPICLAATPATGSCRLRGLMHDCEPT